MVTAFVMIQTASDSIPECAEKISDIEGISEVYSVAGDWDLIAIARVRQHEDLAEVIANKLSKVPGITGTQTHIAFRAYSSHDLDAAFLTRPRVTAPRGPSLPQRRVCRAPTEGMRHTRRCS